MFSTGSNPQQVIDREVNNVKEMMARVDKDNPMRKQMEQVIGERVVSQGSIYFEALAGTHKEKEAKVLVRHNSQVRQFIRDPRRVGSSGRTGRERRFGQ